jgi:cytochrome P450 family 4
MITPAFHYSILQGFQPVFCRKTSAMLSKMFDVAVESKQPIDVFRAITLTTLDIIGMCAFGHEINAIDDPSSPYVLATYELSELFYHRVFQPALLLMPDFLYERITTRGRQWRKALDIIHNLPETVIATRRAALQQGIDTGISVVSHEREYVDFLHILLSSSDDNGNALPDQEIRDEVDTFMFEGHGMLWCTMWRVFV